MGGIDLTFFDACAGIGGFHHGMAAAGFTCVGAAEIDERLQREYPKAFKLDKRRMFGDLHGVIQTKQWQSNRKDMEGCVLTAGFPCQPFSKSGSQLGKKHAEGTVFGCLVEILDDLNCPAFIFENVENLTGPRHVKTFEEMRMILRDMQYDIAFGKYSPHQIGIPQHRQRWFILGVKRKDEEVGTEQGPLLSDMNQKIEATKSRIDVSLKTDILSASALRSGIPLQSIEREALLLWDQYLGWLTENEGLGHTPSPLWGMEVRDNYDIDEIQKVLIARKGSLIKVGQLRNSLKGEAKKDAKEYRYKKEKIIKDYLPPYLSDLEKRRIPYQDWKLHYIKHSRKHMLKIKDWLESQERGDEWSHWVGKLLNMDPTYQKFEWHIRGFSPRTKISNDDIRLKRRFKDRLIQFRPSGIRVSAGDRHPALVAIGQVPVVGNYLKRPTWQALAKLQSIPEEFTAKNAKLFGNGAASGNSGEPIRRLGNAVNVRLVTLLGELLKKELST